MILTADIGNTNITLGIFREDDIIFISRLSTDRHRTESQYAVELKNVFLLDNIDAEKIDGAIISSVVPELTRTIKKAVKMVTGCESLVVAAGIKNGLKIATDNPKELGADLVAGAVGAIAKYPLPCIVMDLGTATKISVIDEGGIFLGCTIAPGVEISLNALSSGTSQLPAIELSAPTNAIGTNTIECIRSGTVLGNACMLDGMADKLEKELGKPIKTLVATGGLAKEIVACCEKEIVYNKDLVLEGLLTIYKKNN
ncbi:MAG: type III pantothenate kinase [Oscillospiraceae bacterium]|nr:type III pantothenate kinase [Oscillospiraceae bacterium]